MYLCVTIKLFFLRNTSIKHFGKDFIRAAALIRQANKNIFTINVLLQSVQALLPVISLYFIKLMIESLTKGSNNFNNFISLIILFGLVQVLHALAGQYATYIGTIHQQKLTDYISEQVLYKAIETDYAYYENPRYHDTLHLAQQQSLYRFPQLLNNFSMVLQNVLSLIFLLAFFFSIHSTFALLFMLLSVPLAAIKWYYGFELIRLERKFASSEREANYLYQILTSVSYAKEVRVFGFGDAFIQKFKNIRLYIRDGKKKLQLKLTVYSLLAEALEIAAMLLIFYFLAKQTWEKTITIGVFVIYIQGFQRLQSTSRNFLQSLVQIFQQRLFLKDLFIFFDIAKQSNKKTEHSFPVIQKGITVSNVSFTYPQTEHAVLQNVSLHCKLGNIIAIAGENGSGKSTLVKLLARLYSLETGSIMFDDKDISTIAEKDFRDNSIFLFQDFEKYFFTVEENIAIGENDKDITADKIERAALLSGADGFISKLSKGYQTRMGRLFEGSEQLSGGQWQKLALSRVFYKDAQLIVLDEPTSSIDATAELNIFKNLKEQLNDKMVILITHRLYNLKIADYIYVMQDGSIAEEGTFDNLIEHYGIFKKMYEAQKL